MTQYNKEELKMMGQLLLGIFLVGGFSSYLFLHISPFPWFALIGASLGLILIISCWTTAKYWFFSLTLLLTTFVFTIVYNWSSFF